jgi:hypothetical protein
VREGEIDLLYPLVLQGQTRANIVLQGIVEDGGPEIHRRGAALGEAYIAYKLPIAPDSDSTAYLKAGQFQIPFGLLAVYDPHLDIVQPLYAQTLGVRLDWGVGVSGRFYGLLNYDFALTAGVGPDHVAIPSQRVATFRLGRTFPLSEGSVNVGGSLLSGRLPVTDINAENPFTEELPPSGRVGADEGYVQKTRIGGDITLEYNKWVARGEAVTGADQDQKIFGYFAEGEYKATDRLSGLIAQSYYQYPNNNSTYLRTSFGGVYRIDPRATFRIVYDLMRDTPHDEPSADRKRLTMQLLLRF